MCIRCRCRKSIHLHIRIANIDSSSPLGCVLGRKMRATRYKIFIHYGEECNEVVESSRSCLHLDRCSGPLATTQHVHSSLLCCIINCLYIANPLSQLAIPNPPDSSPASTDCLSWPDIVLTGEECHMDNGYQSSVFLTNFKFVKRVCRAVLNFIYYTTQNISINCQTIISSDVIARGAFPP
jgi:hypothetical protein